MMYNDVPLTANTTEHKFEMTVDNQTSFIDFKQRDTTVYLVHTEVPDAISGKGVASALVEKTLHYLDEHNLRLVPVCSFVKSYLQKHPEWKRLLAEE